MQQTAVVVDDPGTVDCYKLYGYNWDQCGYCRGGRASSNGAFSDDDRHQQHKQQQQQQANEDDDHAPPATSSPHSRSSNRTYRSYLTKLDSNLRASSYEALLCRGWRRSGAIVYLPDNSITCCPQHTIRLPIADFALNKEQRKVLRKMESLLLNPEDRGDASSKNNNKNDMSKKHRLNDAVMAFLARIGVIASLVKETEIHLAYLLQEIVCKRDTIPPVRYKLRGLINDSSSSVVSLSCPICTALVSRKVIEKKAATDLASRLVKRMQSGQSLSRDVVSSITFTTAGILRVEVPLPDEALADHRSSTTTTTMTTERHSRADLLAAWFEAKGMPVPTDRFIHIQTLPATESAATDPRVHQLYWDYQEAVHGDVHPLKSITASAVVTTPATPVANAAAVSTTTCDVQHHQYSGKKRLSWAVDARARPMLQRTYGGSSSLPSSSSSSDRPIPWQAFASFWDFLVQSPLGASTVHQLYTIGDALVAVGVLDILPTGVSSVYCFYDPTFSKLVQLGTYTAVREIEYTRSLQLSYYYLGYYIESNPKMNYKGDYIGSQVRCTVTGQWVGVDDARKVLRRDERARLGPENHPPLTMASAMVDVGSLPILTNQGIIYGNILQDEDKEYFYPFLEEWVALAGPDVALTATVDIRE